MEWPTLEYEQVLQQHLDAGRIALPGTQPVQEGIERFKALYAELSVANVGERLEQTYAPDIYFNDTLATIRRREALLHYMQETASQVEHTSARVLQVYPGEHDVLLRWQMVIRFKKLAKRRDTFSIGASQLAFDSEGRIVIHQDYWDAAQGLFQHLPLIGFLVRKIRARF